MAVPVFVDGTVWTADDVNQWAVPLAAVKGSAQSVVSSTTLVNDNDLAVTVVASATYILQCFLYFTAASGGDLKWTWAVPSGTTLLYQALHNEGGGTGLNNSALTNAQSDVIMAAGGGAASEAVQMWGGLTVGSTAGTLQLRWAQNTSNGTSTTLKVPSFLKLERIA